MHYICSLWFGIHHILKACCHRWQLWCSGKSTEVGVRTPVLQPSALFLMNVHVFGHSLP